MGWQRLGAGLWFFPPSPPGLWDRPGRVRGVGVKLPISCHDQTPGIRQRTELRRQGSLADQPASHLEIWNPPESTVCDELIPWGVSSKGEELFDPLWLVFLRPFLAPVQACNVQNSELLGFL